MSALQGSALLAPADGDQTDHVVFGGLVVGYQHLSVTFRDDQLLLMTTCPREGRREHCGLCFTASQLRQRTNRSTFSVMSQVKVLAKSKPLHRRLK